MPGLGRKTFIATEVLTAANVNGYLMDQSVMVFAGTAARASAIGTAVSEGMVSYLTDSDSLQYYNGSAWTAVDTAGSGNAIINGAFDIWQRGTSFSNPASGAYIADRFLINYDGTGATRTLSQQTFTPGAAPVAGYEGTFFYRYAHTVAGTLGTYNNILQQYIEDVRSFAGQTVTFSFWAKAASNVSLTMGIAQNFGAGGSSVVGVGTQSISVTTSWTRFTYTVAIPSVSGKTIGTSSKLDAYVQLAPNLAATIDFWGVQVEAGSTATPFKRNASNIQGELAACQRYYQRITSTSAFANVTGAGSARSTTSGFFMFPHKTTFRASPTSIEFSSIAFDDGANALVAATAITLAGISPDCVVVLATASSGLTQYRPYTLIGNNNAAAFIGVSAEL